MSLFSICRHPASGVAVVNIFKRLLSREADSFHNSHITSIVRGGGRKVVFLFQLDKNSGCNGIFFSVSMGIFGFF